MWLKNIFIFVCIMISAGQCLYGQEPVIQTDSAHLYKQIETFSKKKKFTKFIFQLVFKPLPARTSPKIIKKLINKPYSSFEGKIIRNINIVTLDPFGFSVKDTSRLPRSFVEKGGNAIHLKSLHITIRNLLLIHQNEAFDSLQVKESERLIRSQPYVQQVEMIPISIKDNPDSVDINIRVLDNWSIIPQGAFSTSRIPIDITDKNFLGLGHSFEVAYTWNHTNGRDAFTSNYSIPNIRNTYISVKLHYGIDENDNFSKLISVERPFFSPYARWAAGINIAQAYKKDSILYQDSLYVQQPFKFNTQDYWAGFAAQIFGRTNEDERTTNLILSARFLRIRYLEHPEEIYDSLHIYSNEHFYLTGIGISTRKYVQDKYIFNFGFTEDVPVGRIYGLTGGYQVKNNIGRMYASARFSYGNYNAWGYLSTNLEFGSFFRNALMEQGVFTGSLNYFTPLIEIGRWKFRQFIKPQVTFGINRYYTDRLNINNENGIRGFSSSTLRGSQRIVFTLQTQSYAPWNVFGFRFGPYLICSLGMLGNASTGFRNSAVFSQLGIGALIKNDYLIFSDFHLSIAFYPNIPGSGNNIFKFNSFKTTDFGFRDFELGKPSTIPFQ